MVFIQHSSFHSISSQFIRLEERQKAIPFETEFCGMKIIVDTGVYQTSGDSILMAESIHIGKNENFLEIGCGTGAVSIFLAKNAISGIGVDINEKAVRNSKENALLQGIHNVAFLQSNVFEHVNGTFDVVICNPPYTNHTIRNDIDRMFWDPEDEMKKKFFNDVGTYLKPNGRIYFGWANFADIDIDLPFRLAKENGYKFINISSTPHGDDFNFYVLEFGV